MGWNQDRSMLKYFFFTNLLDLLHIWIQGIILYFKKSSFFFYKKKIKKQPEKMHTYYWKHLYVQ